MLIPYLINMSLAVCADGSLIPTLCLAFLDISFGEFWVSTQNVFSTVWHTSLCCSTSTRIPFISGIILINCRSHFESTDIESRDLEIYAIHLFNDTNVTISKNNSRKLKNLKMGPWLRWKFLCTHFTNSLSLTSVTIKIRFEINRLCAFRWFT